MENHNLYNDELFVRTTSYNRMSEQNVNEVQLRPAIEFNLPYNSKVSLLISDVNGRKVVTLINNKYLKKGFHFRELDFSNLPGGEYYYKIETKNNNQIKKLQLIK